MWRRVGGTISCAACLLLACGKSEQGTPGAGDSAGSSTSGATSTSSGTGNSAGAAVSAGGAIAQGGSAATGGKVSNGGGQAEAGTTAAGGEASDGGATSEGGAASCSGSYRACGCGCCAGQTSPPTCVYPELGDDLAALIAADEALKHDLQTCISAGCSRGVDYVCCESPAPSAEEATYTASLLIGAIDRIRIDKMTTDCSALTLRQATPGTPVQPGFRLETPAGWEMQQATRLPCISSAIGPSAIGAIGKLSLRVLGNTCVVDVHLALFFGDAANGVDAERFDADALPLDLPVAQCH